MNGTDTDTIVVGGGLYGACIALQRREVLGRDAILIDADTDLLLRASWGNQARIHNGYHYPRSVVTAHRSRVNMPRFVREFADCVHDDFHKVYAIGRRFSKVTAAQFRLFCERIGASIEPASDELRELFDEDHIEAVFSVKEAAFDADTLREMLRQRLSAAGIDVRLRTKATRVHALDDGTLELEVESGGRVDRLRARNVIVCTYSRTNQLLDASGLELIPLKHELTEMSVVEPPEALRDLGVTVMCGPFFSIMPFPALGLHSLSHVRYTPHCEWHDRPGEPYHDAYERLNRMPRRSRHVMMVRDAQRYLPAIAGARQVRSIFEVKTVLPRNEVDDGRPILLKRDHGLPGLTCVMGSKIDNVYDVLEHLAREGDDREVMRA